MNVVYEIIQFTYSFIKNYRFRILVYLVAGSILFLISAITPLVIGFFIDAFSNDINTNTITVLCFIFFILNILQILLCYYIKIEGTKICTGASNKMKADFFLHLQKISPLTNKIDDPAALANRINNDSEYLIMFLCNTGMQFPGKALSIIVIFTYILLKSIPLAIVCFLVIPVSIYFHKKTRSVVYETSYASENARNQFFAIMYEQLGQVQLIRTNAIFDFMHDRVLKAGDVCLDAFVNEERKQFKYSLFSQNTDIFLKLFLFVFGGLLLINKNITIGTFTILYSYLGLFSENLAYFINFSQESYQYKAYLDRLKEVNVIKEEYIGYNTLTNIDKIDIRNMDFCYQEDKTIYTNYNYSFQKGRLYCLVGDNGTGKSTLIRNILGLYLDATGTSIYYDEKPLKDIDIYTVRKNLIGVCDQEPIMLDDSLYHNLFCNNKEINIDIFRDICSKLDLFCDLDLNAFEEIMNANATELSGGQKQKFALARAIYKSPSVLILDEPTSALDNSGIHALKKLLLSLKNDTIIIIISHDSEIINLADEIIKIA